MKSIFRLALGLCPAMSLGLITGVGQAAGPISLPAVAADGQPIRTEYQSSLPPFYSSDVSRSTHKPAPSNPYRSVGYESIPVGMMQAGCADCQSQGTMLTGGAGLQDGEWFPGPCAKQIVRWATFRPGPAVLPKKIPNAVHSPLMSYFPCQPLPAGCGPCGSPGMPAEIVVKPYTAPQYMLQGVRVRPIPLVAPTEPTERRSPLMERDDPRQPDGPKASPKEKKENDSDGTNERTTSQPAQPKLRKVSHTTPIPQSSPLALPTAHQARQGQPQPQPQVLPGTTVPAASPSYGYATMAADTKQQNANRKLKDRLTDFFEANIVSERVDSLLSPKVEPIVYPGWIYAQEPTPPVSTGDNVPGYRYAQTSIKPCPPAYGKSLDGECTVCPVQAESIQQVEHRSQKATGSVPQPKLVGQKRQAPSGLPLAEPIPVSVHPKMPPPAKTTYRVPAGR